ncbi:P25-alpha [Dunaliella salina]|uniref:P25-alpha n=1 Tax=Dunaliella salina TaxID=3046 RepID=A0ABQ7H1S3_DUNSA|nr:P25-alpha [Dunaliella salina]|eukprot:KAF5840804.1 P25-alpha [Dunaliella salina]
MESSFLAYCSIGGKKPELSSAQLEGAKFLKMMREAKLIGGKLDAPKVDVIFMRASKAGKRISYAQFQDAIQQVAEAKGLSVEQVTAKLASADPSTGITKAEAVRHHDDKSTYTGMHVGK